MKKTEQDIIAEAINDHLKSDERKEFERNLRPGDEVHWEDPDNGIGSGIHKIVKIDHKAGIAHITRDGSHTEAFLHELS